MKALTTVQAEAIAQADAYLNNAGLPTYTHVSGELSFYTPLASGRNLYALILCNKVVAHLTARSIDQARAIYIARTGCNDSTMTVNRLSFGYPCDVCDVYA